MVRKMACMTPEEIDELTGITVKVVIRRRMIEQARELAAEAESTRTQRARRRA